MKKLLTTGFILLAVPSAFATQLANPEQMKLTKSFHPPKPITPMNAQSYMPENQFDDNDRAKYFSVAERVNKGLSPFKISSGVYGTSFYNSIFSGFRNANIYGIFNANHTKANGYKDGNHHKVDWKYNRFNQIAVLGFVPHQNQEHRLTIIHDNIKDDQQPEHKMDAINTDRLITKINSRFGQEDLSNTLSSEFMYRHIKRKADNYHLRIKPPKSVYMKINRDIFDLKLKYDRDFGAFHNLVGLSYEHDEHTGKRFLHTDKKDIVNGYRYADLKINRFRLFDTLSYTINPQHKMALGITYEHNHVNVDKDKITLPFPTQKLKMKGSRFANPQDLWQQYFGIESNGHIKKNAFSYEFQYDFTPTDLQQYTLNLGHIERIGDNTERFNSISAVLMHPKMGTIIPLDPSLPIPLKQQEAMKAASAIVSNPYINPEKHNFIKLSFDLKNKFYKGYMNSLMGNGFNIGGSFMFDKVDDLIIFDRAHGQKGILLKNNAVISRNVDAKIFSANLYANYNLQNWGIGIKSFYHYGQNTTDDRPLYQIRPFEIITNVDYKNYFKYGSYNLGFAIRHVASQHRGDFNTETGLGIDNKDASKGFTTADIYSSVNFKDQYAIRFGVNNLFNRQFAEFISGDHVMALKPNLVYAPGRTYWLSLHASF